MRANFLLLLFALVLSAIGAEAAFRLTPARATTLTQPHDFFLTGTPAFRRDFQYSEQKPANTFRIIVIGDSFTYPWKMQFYDSYPKRLEWMLNLHSSSSRVEVLNFGIPGKATERHYWTLEQAVARWDPDLVVLQNTLNDPDNTPYSWRFRRKIQWWKNLQHSWLVQNSLLLTTLTSSIKSSVLHRHMQEYLHSLFFSERSWKHWRSEVTKIHEYCQNHAVPCVSVTFPMFGFPENGPDSFADVHERINLLFSSLNFPHLDLRPAYAGADQARMMIAPGIDSHPNEIAHRIAAEAILPWLLENKFVPTRYTPEFSTPEHESRPPKYVVVEKNPSPESRFIQRFVQKRPVDTHVNN